tara:strand:- start:1918 stop:2556 length:639 start_codon:yes stop_codon:yes gene_type:complete
MCGRYELKTEFADLPSLLKKEYPKGLEEKYAKQTLIRPTDPVLVLKNEGKTTTSLMLWGFISEWAKNPFQKENNKPFNARAETIDKKKLFRGSWKHKRCLLPASGFFEKGHRISRQDQQPFWLAGIWNRWMSAEGSEIESCCVITTESNKLIQPIHNRMPVIVPQGLEEEWVTSVKNESELRALKPILSPWNSKGWKTEPIAQASMFQMNLF